MTFDVTHTLLYTPRLAAIYAQVLDRHGLAPDTAAARARLAAMIPEVWRELGCRSDPRRDRFAAHPDGARGWWRDFLGRLCARLELAAPSRFAAAELFDRFGRADAWAVYPDVEPTLIALSRRGLRLGVISNWDQRLPTVLAGLGLDRYFHTVTVSAEVGREKPHPAIFAHCLERLATPPAAALHVGDRQLEDVEGAIGAGMQALRIDRRQDARNGLAAVLGRADLPR